MTDGVVPSAVPGRGQAILGAFLAHLITFGLIYSLSVFLPALERETGLSRTASSLVPALASAIVVALSVFAGPLSDRVGAARSVAAGGVISGLGLLLASVASPITVVLGLGIILGLGGTLAFTPAVAASRRAGGEQPGGAIGLAAAGAGVGVAVVGPLSSWLLGFGLQTALQVLAGMSFAVLVLAGALLWKADQRTPSGGFRDAYRAFFAGSGAAVDRRRLFLAGVLLSFGYYVPFAHFIPYAVSIDIDVRTGTTMLAALGVANTLGRLALGPVGDRWGHARTLRLVLAVLGGLVGLWALLPGRSMFWLFAVGFGTAAGGFVAVYPALGSRLAGHAQDGATAGILYSGMATGAFLGPVGAGWLFDAGGSYELALLVAAAFPLLAIPLVARDGPASGSPTART